jgi:arylsulfatase A
VIEAPVKQSTLTQRYTEQALQFIRDNRSRPFLLYLPYTMPHVPVSASERFRGRSHYGPYGDAVEEIDWSVGQVLDCLHENGIDNNTLAIFTSDNGPALSVPAGGSAGGLRGGKSTSWEGGVRVPGVCRWPQQVPAGVVRPGITCLMDIFATCIALSGAQLPDERPIDGLNLMPFLQNDSVRLRQDFFYYMGSSLCAVRAGPWKLHMIKREYDRHRKPGPLINCNPPELYNLEEDVGERHNLYAGNREVVETLQAVSGEFQDAVNVGRLPKSYWRSLTPAIRRRKNHQP